MPQDFFLILNEPYTSVLMLLDCHFMIVKNQVGYFIIHDFNPEKKILARIIFGIIFILIKTKKQFFKNS